MNQTDKHWSRRVLIAGLALGLFVLVGWMFAYALSLVLLVVAGVLVAIALVKATRLASRWTGLSYRYAYAIVLTLTIFLSGGLIYLIGDSIFQYGQQLVEQIGTSSDEVLAKVREHSWGKWLLKEFPELEKAADEGEVPEEVRDAAARGVRASDDAERRSSDGPPAILRGAMNSQGLLPMVGTFFSVTTSTLGGLLLVGFLAVYFALDPDLYAHGMTKLVPIHRRERFLEVLHLIANTLWWWILGRLLAMAIIGGLSTLGLWLIGIPMALPLGVLAGLLNFVPNVGPTLALIPPLLIGLQQGSSEAIYVFCLYMVLQFIETYLVTPLIEQRQVSLPPGVTIPVQALFGLTVGVFGLLMATPMAAIAMVLVREYYVKDWLEDYECDDPHALEAEEVSKEAAEQKAEQKAENGERKAAAK